MTETTSNSNEKDVIPDLIVREIKTCTFLIEFHSTIPSDLEVYGLNRVCEAHSSFSIERGDTFSKLKTKVILIDRKSKTNSILRSFAINSSLADEWVDDAIAYIAGPSSAVDKLLHLTENSSPLSELDKLLIFLDDPYDFDRIPSPSEKLQYLHKNFLTLITMLGKRKRSSEEDDFKKLESIYPGCAHSRDVFLTVYPTIDEQIKITFWDQKEKEKEHNEERNSRAKKRKLGTEDHNNEKNDSHMENHEDGFSMLQGLLYLQRSNVNMSSLGNALMGASDVLETAQLNQMVNELPKEALLETRDEILSLLNTAKQSKSQAKEKNFDIVMKAINQGLSDEELDTIKKCNVFVLQKKKKK